MQTLAVLLLTACLLGVAVGWIFPKVRAVGLAAGAVLVAMVAWVIWWGLLMFQVVSLDAINRLFNITRPALLSGLLIGFGPPMLAAAIFIVVAVRRS